VGHVQGAGRRHKLLLRVRVAPPAVQVQAGFVSGQAVARVVEHEDAAVGARGRPLADDQVVVAVAVDVHALDRSGILGVDVAGGPPRHALDVGELAVARVEEDLVRVGVRAGTSSWGSGVEIGLKSS
jgi:hypothetical protein